MKLMWLGYLVYMKLYIETSLPSFAPINAIPIGLFSSSEKGKCLLSRNEFVLHRIGKYIQYDFKLSR